MHDQKQGKYVFDRKVSMPDELLADVQPYPMPTRRILAEHFDDDEILKGPYGMMWKDHLTLSIGSDLQGASFHRHNAAWNVVLFGAKRWILYDYQRYENNMTRLHRMAGDEGKKCILAEDCNKRGGMVRIAASEQRYFQRLLFGMMN